MYENKKRITDGYRPVSQVPLDDRLVVANTSELADLGTDDEKAYQYYEGMIVFSILEGSHYKWVEDNSGNGLIGGFTYPANITTTDVDYSNRIFDFVEIEIGLPTKIITHADLLTLYSNAQLTIGRKYIISDFATKHVIPNSGGTINTGITESLEVQAISINKLSLVAKSPSYPQDIIHYEIIDTSTAGGDKGRIYYREDTNLKISTHYDWRNVKFRRFRNAQSLSLIVGGFSLNLLGSKITGGTSGAVGYVVSGLGSNTLRVVNHTGLFVSGELITQDTGSTRTIDVASDYSFETDTHTSNGRASSDVYTFVDTVATGMYNIKIGKPGLLGPSDQLNNISFLAGSYNVNLADDCYNCTMNVCYDFVSSSQFYDNYFEGGVSLSVFLKNTSINKIYNQSYGTHSSSYFTNNVISSGFIFNSISGRGFSQNNIARGFSYNVILNDFSINVVETPDMKDNQIEGEVAGQTFLYAATSIGQNHSKRILKASNGTLYLEYYNGAALVYVDPLTA